MDTTPAPTRRRWPRVVLTLPPDTAADLGALARANLRAPKAEALRLVLEGLARERRQTRERPR